MLGLWQDMHEICSIVSQERLPAAVVDLDALDTNIARVKAHLHSKALRIATKSIRCPALVEYIAAQLGSQCAGLMTYHAEETLFWAKRGGTAAGNLLLAYPTMQRLDAEALLAANLRPGVTASVVVDDEAQLAVLNDCVARAGKGVPKKIPVVIELDVALRPVQRMHLGARRSPLRSPADVVALVESIRRHPNLVFHGVMAYEAHTAGLTDNNPFAPKLNRPKRLFKKWARKELEQSRASVVRALAERGTPAKIVNGGGTGTLPSASRESCLTEVTAGSAFLPGHLFDYYTGLAWAPSLFFALQVVRSPAPGFATCHGGGYVASGEAGADRLPLPVYPKSLKLLQPEGAGEVQTPLNTGNKSLRLGDVVLFRHAKSGELAEHFNEYLFVRAGKLVERAKTYRGFGERFL